MRGGPAPPVALLLLLLLNGVGRGAALRGGGCSNCCNCWNCWPGLGAAFLGGPEPPNDGGFGFWLYGALAPLPAAAAGAGRPNGAPGTGAALRGGPPPGTGAALRGGPGTGAALRGGPDDMEKRKGRTKKEQKSGLDTSKGIT